MGLTKEDSTENRMEVLQAKETAKETASVKVTVRVTVKVAELGFLEYTWAL